jgi:hypothetical protein
MQDIRFVVLSLIYAAYSNWNQGNKNSTTSNVFVPAFIPKAWIGGWITVKNSRNEKVITP